MRNSTVTLEPSSIVSLNLNTEQQVVKRFTLNYQNVSNHTLIDYSVFAERKVQDRKKRYAKAADMMKKWASENSEYDERTWPSLEKELQEATIKLRKDQECD